MLVIRMQRSGRKGHAMFRVVVQDSRRTPTSGKVVAQLGSYDPHAKAAIVDKEKAQFYLDHGAQPSERAARLLKTEGLKLPDWVALPDQKQRSVRNADKRRSTRPEAPAEEAVAEPEAAPEAPEATSEAPAEEKPVEEAPAPEETTPETPEAAPETEAPEEAPVDDKPTEAEAPKEEATPEAEEPATDDTTPAAEAETPEPAAEAPEAEAASEKTD